VEVRAAAEEAARLGDAAAPALAAALLRAGDADGAAAVLLAAAERSPDDVRVRTALVRALLGLGRAADALAAAGSADSRDPDLLGARGDAAAAADPAEAERCWGAALALRPDDPALLVRRHGRGLSASSRPR